MTIILSPRMTDKVIGEIHTGSKIVWVKIVDPVCNISYVVVYVPYQGRTQKPMAKDTLTQLKKLLQKKRKSDYIIVMGDLNCETRYGYVHPRLEGIKPVQYSF